MTIENSIKKSNRELIQLHRGLLIKQMNQMDIFSLRQKQILLKAYNQSINLDNIKGFYNVHIREFLVHLILGKLDLIFNPIKLEAL